MHTGRARQAEPSEREYRSRGVLYSAPAISINSYVRSQYNRGRPLYIMMHAPHRRALTCRICHQNFFPASLKFHVKVQSILLCYTIVRRV